LVVAGFVGEAGEDALRMNNLWWAVAWKDAQAIVSRPSSPGFKVACPLGLPDGQKSATPLRLEVVDDAPHGFGMTSPRNRLGLLLFVQVSVGVETLSSALSEKSRVSASKTRGVNTLYTPLSRRLELITFIPFVLRNNVETGSPLIKQGGQPATTTQSHTGLGDPRPRPYARFPPAPLAADPRERQVRQ
jgi:hypothetical protein